MYKAIGTGARIVAGFCRNPLFQGYFMADLWLQARLSSLPLSSARPGVNPVAGSRFLGRHHD